MLAVFVQPNIKKKVGRYIVELAESNKMPYGKFICPAFITGIHSLRSTKDLCKLDLGQIVVFP